MKVKAYVQRGSSVSVSRSGESLNIIVPNAVNSRNATVDVIRLAASCLGVSNSDVKVVEGEGTAIVTLEVNKK